MQTEKKRVTKDLTEGNIYKNFILYVIPLILAALLSQAYSTIDSVIAGKYVGDYALGAIGAASSLSTFLSTLFSGFSVGFSIYVARLFGRKDYAKLKSDIVNVMLFLIGCLVLVGVLCVVFCKPIFAFLRVDDEILIDAMIYFCITKAGFFLIVGNSALVQILHALGVTGFSFYMSLLSAVLNIGGNIVSVTVLHMGIAGIALSTVLSSAVVMVFYLLKLRACFRELPCEKTPFRFSLHSVGASLRYSLPVCLQQGSMYFAGLVLSPITNGLGAAATTGYAVSNRFASVCATVYQNSSKVVSTYTAQSIGAGKTDRIRKGLFAGAVQSFVLVAPVLLACVLFARPISSIFFTNGYTGEAFEYAVRFAVIYLPFLLFNVINNLMHSFFRGMGALGTLIFSTAFGSAVRILLTFLLVGSMHIDGIYFGWAASWVAEALLCFVIYLCRYRNEKMIQKRIAEG